MLAKEEYEILYYTNICRNSLNRLNAMFNDMDKIKSIIRKLEGDGLIKLEMRDNDIYGFMETNKGRKLLKSLSIADSLRVR